MFITFYSYKGGVGRSMALANTACLLAQDEEHPQSVLVWDFDLEAPGLHRLFPPQQPHKSGFVDLAHCYARTGKTVDVSDYIYRSVVPGVDVLPAGTVDQAYCEKLQELHWPAFFTSDIAERGPFFGPLRDSLETLGYDYILIDSRTGLNDQAGICTVILPDLLLVFFRLTAQNIDGLRHIVPMFGNQLKSRNRKQVRILPIASMVSPTSSEETLANKHAAMEIFHNDALNHIPFDGDMVTEERLFCLRAQTEKTWPTPPIVDYYHRLCEAIRQKNTADTKTATEEIRHAMGRGDLVSAARLLKPTLERRPRNDRLWKTLTHLYQIGPIDRKDTDELVEAILQKDAKNSFCYEWKAMSLLEDAESPDSPSLIDAKDNLERAIATSNDSSRLYRTLARVNSCHGDLDGAVQALRNAQKKFKKNAQLYLELAMLYIRMGSNYFSSAIDSVQEITDDVEAKHLWLAFLWTFLEEYPKAKHSFGVFTKRASTEWRHLCRVHLWLLMGEKEKALGIANNEKQQFSHPEHASNWAEFYICAQDFDRAIEILTPSSKKRRTEECRHALLSLCHYLRGDLDIQETDALEAWREIDNWGFKELVFFRERCRKDRNEQLVQRLSIVERLIRQQELADFSRRPGIVISGPSGIGPIRILAKKIEQTFGEIVGLHELSE